MTCDRVVIINKGRVAAVDTPQNLTSQMRGGERVRLEVGATNRAVAAALGEIPGLVITGLDSIGSSGRIAVTVETKSEKDIRAEVAAKIVGKGMGLYELRGASLSLEEIFLKLTIEDPAQKPAAQGGGNQMRTLYAIYRKEMNHYFVSPMAWIVVGVFLGLSG